MKPAGITSYGRRVHARTTLAETLGEARCAARATQAGLLPADLRRIVEFGRAAETADREQQEKLAERTHERQQLRDLRDHVDELVGALRNRTPAVVLDLATNPETQPLARFLDNLGFDRFRVRTLPAEPAADGAAPAAPVRVQVAREDRLTQAQAAEQFATALSTPERAPIVEAYARRGFSRDTLQTLAAEAGRLAGAYTGATHGLPIEATAREAAAVAAQKQLWTACRRMIRQAVQGEPELEALYAAC